jgi:P-type Mg2+ transporter
MATLRPTAPWTRPTSEVLSDLGSHPDGLTPAEARRRLAEDGPNAVARERPRSALRILLAQLTSPLILVLIAAAIVSRYLGESVEASVIVAIVLVNAALGTFQESRAERSLRALRRLVTHTATVRRGGSLVEIPATDLVHGDVVVLEIGDVVPADLRLLSLDGLSCDEATLTGESVPVAKRTDPLPASASQPHQQINLAFMGTAVAGGAGEGVVIATGARTRFGRSAALEQHPHETEFQRSIRRFSDFLLIVILAMTAFVFLANALLGKGTFDSLLFAIALAVGITPEALPVIVTIALSNGALRMAREKVVTRRLLSVEDLGNVDVLCCDKTGTLTEGTVSLVEYVDVEGARDLDVLRLGLLTGRSRGRAATAIAALDRALWRSPDARPLRAALSGERVLHRNEFDFQRRRLSVVARENDHLALVVKGAPESVLAVCRSAVVNGAPQPLTAALAAGLQQRVTTYEAQGYRVLAVAEKTVPAADTSVHDEAGLTARGFLLFLDPPKHAARDSLHRLHRLGVSLKVMSGDSAVVTRHICHEVDLSITEDRIVTGAELDAFDPAAFAEAARRYNVFARVTPDHKFRLVTALGAAGHVVGFLGDGVNDVPALKAADVGICVNTGADVAKDAADMILLKKSLRVLAQGIVEGRKTFSNITKYVLNTVSANFGNMVTVAVSSLFLRFIPLLPSQILLTNLVSDLPLVTISTDRVDPEMLERPRRWDISLIARFMVGFGLLSVLFDLTLIAGLLAVARVGPSVFRTAWFVESACSEILVTFAIRTRLPFYRSRPGRWLLLASVAAGLVAIALPFVPMGGAYFAFTPLPRSILGFIAILLVGYFLAAELAKRRYFGVGRVAGTPHHRFTAPSTPRA